MQFVHDLIWPFLQKAQNPGLYSLSHGISHSVVPNASPVFGWTALSLQQSGMFFLLSIVLFTLTEYLVQIIRWSSDGPRYFISAEATSERLARRERLNVEQVQAPQPDEQLG